MKTNISTTKDCYGCGVCAISCPRKIIDIRLNSSGFWEPVLFDEERCTECGICLDVCSFEHTDTAPLKDRNKDEYYACRSKDKETVFSTSSGGVCYELCKLLIAKGFKVISVAYNVRSAQAEHYMAEKIEDLEKGKRSKYIPSYTLNGFLNINRKEKFAIISTPCHIDSLRRYAQKYKIEHNFILIDFFCHGVPSMLLWKKYLQQVQPVTGEVVKATWRNKSTQWNESWQNISKPENYDQLDWFNSLRIKIWGANGNFQYKKRSKDMFYSFFLGHRCLAKPCYEQCKYKVLSSAADIRVGDFWGRTYQYDKKGVSSVIALTTSGKALISELHNFCEIYSHSREEVIEGQMKYNARRARSYPYAMKQLHTGKNLSQINFVADFIDRKWFVFRAFRKLKSIVFR